MCVRCVKNRPGRNFKRGKKPKGASTAESTKVVNNFKARANAYYYNANKSNNKERFANKKMCRKKAKKKIIIMMKAM